MQKRVTLRGMTRNKNSGLPEMVDMFHNILSSLKIYAIQVRQNWLIGLAWKATALETWVYLSLPKLFEYNFLLF